MRLQKLNLTSIVKEAKWKGFNVEIIEKSLSSCNGKINSKRKFNLVYLPGPHVILSIQIPEKEMALPNAGYIFVNEISRQIGNRPFCRYKRRGLFSWEWLPKDGSQAHRFEMLERLNPPLLQWSNGIIGF